MCPIPSSVFKLCFLSTVFMSCEHFSDGNFNGADGLNYKLPTIFVEDCFLVSLPDEGIRLIVTVTGVACVFIAVVGAALGYRWHLKKMKKMALRSGLIFISFFI